MMQSTATAGVLTQDLLVVRRHVDLVRVASALCQG